LPALKVTTRRIVPEWPTLSQAQSQFCACLEVCSSSGENCLCLRCLSANPEIHLSAATLFVSDLCKRTATEFGLCDSAGVCEDASGGETAFDKIEDFFRYVERSVFLLDRISFWHSSSCVWGGEERVGHARFFELRSSPRIPALASTVISTPKRHWTGSNARMRTSPTELGSALAS